MFLTPLSSIKSSSQSPFGSSGSSVVVPVNQFRGIISPAECVAPWLKKVESPTDETKHLYFSSSQETVVQMCSYVSNVDPYKYKELMVSLVFDWFIS